jgi:hypothetical protein
MSKVNGQVWKVMDKDFRGKTLWSVRLENDPIYYRLNENRYPGIVEPGAYIEFEAETNPDGKSAQVKGAPKQVVAAVAPPAASGAVSSGGGGGGGRDVNIQYQSSRKDALVFVALAVSSGAIVLPAKASGKLAALEALVDSYTALYLEDIGTGAAVSRATARAYEQEAAAEATPNPSGKKKVKQAAADFGDDEEGDDDE